MGGAVVGVGGTTERTPDLRPVGPARDSHVVLLERHELLALGGELLRGGREAADGEDPVGAVGPRVDANDAGPLLHDRSPGLIRQEERDVRRSGARI